MELLANPDAPVAPTARRRGLAGLSPSGRGELAATELAAVKRLELLLALGGALVHVVEAAEEDERTPGRLPGSFYSTRLPLLLAQVRLWLSALDALGGRAPAAVVGLVEQPGLLREQGSRVIVTALEEIDLAIRAEGSPASRGA